MSLCKVHMSDPQQESASCGVDQRIRTCQGHYDCLALPKIRLEVIQIHKHVRTRNAFVERVLTNQCTPKLERS
ncbi:hypothetical protein KCU87_g488, partial [Aureobasidium melanogenum]